MLLSGESPLSPPVARLFAKTVRFRFYHIKERSRLPDYNDASYLTVAVSKPTPPPGQGSSFAGSKVAAMHHTNRPYKPRNVRRGRPGNRNITLANSVRPPGCVADLLYYGLPADICMFKYAPQEIRRQAMPSLHHNRFVNKISIRYSLIMWLF